MFTNHLQILRRNRQRIRKIPLKSLISEGFWSEWGDLNTQPRHPKCRALPVEPHPVIHFSAIIPRRGRKSKIFLSVVIYVVKAAFMPLSATGRNPANAGVTRLSGVSPCSVPDTATAHPKSWRKVFCIISVYFLTFLLWFICFPSLFRGAVSMCSTPHCG